MAQVFAAVKGFIRDGDKYLVIKQNIGDGIFYDIPGGKVDFGESPYDTLHREIKEEVGLEVEIIKPLGMWWFFRNSDGNEVVCNTFLCRPLHHNVNTAHNPSATEKIESVHWMTREELLESVSNESLKELVKNL